MSDEATLAEPEGRTARTLRVVPPSRLARMRGPRLNTAEDVLRELGRVYRAMKRGEVSTQDGSRLAFVLHTAGKLIEVAMLEQRIERLETAAVQQRLDP